MARTASDQFAVVLAAAGVTGNYIIVGDNPTAFPAHSASKASRGRMCGVTKSSISLRPTCGAKEES